MSIGPVYFHFKVFWVVVFIFIQILIEHSVSKQCRSWSDATFCGVWSGSARFAYVPKQDARIKWVKHIQLLEMHTIYKLYNWEYSKTGLKRPLKKKTKNWFSRPIIA